MVVSRDELDIGGLSSFSWMRPAFGRCSRWMPQVVQRAVPWWLVVGHRIVGLTKCIACLAVRDKKRIHAREITADQRHALGFPNKVECFQAGAKMVCAIPRRTGLIGHFNGNGRRNGGVILNASDSGCSIQGTPDMAGILVHIDRNVVKNHGSVVAIQYLVNVIRLHKDLNDF